MTKINFYGLILYRGDIVKILENLKRGMTELLILLLLKEDDMYGYQLTDAIYGEYLSITEGIHKILNYTGE